MQPASLMASAPPVVRRHDESDDVDAADAPPISVVDTTAELLGRASGKRPRSRAAAAAGAEVSGNRAPRGTRKAAPKKAAAAPRRPRKKAAAE